MKVGQRRSHQAYCQEEKKDLVQKVGAHRPQVLDRRKQKRALDLLAEYHDTFTLEDGEMGCTGAAKHKNKVTNSKPLKVRPRNIPSGLLEEVQDHLDHMIDVGVIKPSKSTWSIAVVLVWKKDGGLRFCINF